jgi:hypothetical protein
MIGYEFHIFAETQKKEGLKSLPVVNIIFRLNDSERPSHHDKSSDHGLFDSHGKDPVSCKLNMEC